MAQHFLRCIRRGQWNWRHVGSVFLEQCAECTGGHVSLLTHFLFLLFNTTEQCVSRNDYFAFEYSQHRERESFQLHVDVYHPDENGDVNSLKRLLSSGDFSELKIGSYLTGSLHRAVHTIQCKTRLQMRQCRFYFQTYTSFHLERFAGKERAINYCRTPALQFKT